MPKKRNIGKQQPVKEKRAQPAAARKKAAPRKSGRRKVASIATQGLLTEAEWARHTDPTPMLQYVRTSATDRKRRLFACACCRRIWSRLADEFQFCRRAVEVAERFADGLATESERHDYYCIVNEEDDEDVVDAAYVAACRVIALDGEGLDGERDFASATAHCAASATPRPERERAAQCRLVRCIFGNPFRPVTLDPAWRTGNATALAQSIYADRAFDRLPILADALEDAGCDNADILNHCRQPGEHVRGCWVVDLLLGK
jgi:hypothetical protein